MRFKNPCKKCLVAPVCDNIDKLCIPKNDYCNTYENINMGFILCILIIIYPFELIQHKISERKFKKLNPGPRCYERKTNGSISM